VEHFENLNLYCLIFHSFQKYFLNLVGFQIEDDESRRVRIAKWAASFDLVQ
jgi:hypothetical protein